MMEFEDIKEVVRDLARFANEYKLQTSISWDAMNGELNISIEPWESYRDTSTSIYTST